MASYSAECNVLKSVHPLKHDSAGRLGADYAILLR